jgi:N-acetylglutamate synthase-like GNAT family acetyltransferase
MNNEIAVKLCSGTEAAKLVDPFYERFGFSGRARGTDTFFLAMKDDELVGAVRYCVEENIPMLRTMMIHPDYRRQGVGQMLLAEFARFLDARGIRNVYCLPYSHLAVFYSSIGFVGADDVPELLKERMRAYATTGEKTICMKRP